MKFFAPAALMVLVELLCALVSPVYGQGYALSLLDHPASGTPVDFTGSRSPVLTSSQSGDSILYTTPPGTFQSGNRYRVSLHYHVVQGAPETGIACLLLRDRHVWSSTLLPKTPGAAYQAAYEFVADAPNDNFQIGLRGPGRIAVDDLKIEKLPVIVFTPDNALAMPAHPEPLRNHVGICAHLQWSYFYKTDDEIRLGLDRLQQSGATWLRDGLSWETLFPEPGGVPSATALRRADFVVDEALKRHLKILAIVGATPSWAAAPHGKNEEAWKLPAAHLADYEHYVRFIAERYRSKVEAWEIYNETNGGFWDAPFASYLEELRAAGTILHQVDPKNVVVSAGLVEAGLLEVKEARRQPYLDLLSPENAGYYDAFGFHSYADFHGTLYMLNVIGELMKSNGTRKPIWITETGFTVTGPRNEQQQADDISERIKMLSRDPLVENVIIYNLRMKVFEKDPSERGYGLIRGDFSPRPVFTALQRLLNSAVLQKDPAITAADGL